MTPIADYAATGEREVREVEEKKNPRIPPWKVWILVISIVQLIAAISSYWVHQQMWEAIDHTQTVQNQVLKKEVEHHQNMNHTLEVVLQKLQEQ